MQMLLPCRLLLSCFLTDARSCWIKMRHTMDASGTIQAMVILTKWLADHNEMHLNNLRQSFSPGFDYQILAGPVFILIYTFAGNILVHHYYCLIAFVYECCICSIVQPRLKVFVCTGIPLGLAADSYNRKVQWVGAHCMFTIRIVNKM